MLVLLITMLPVMAVQADAHYEVPIYWTEEIYELDGYRGYIYEFEQVQKECCGFYLGYCITDISTGNLKGDFNVEVCVHDTSGNWFVAEMFTYDSVGEEILEQVSWDDPRKIDKFTIIIRKQGFSGYQSVYIANPMTSSDPWQERIPCHISDEQFKKSGKTAYPYVLEETLYDCQGFTLHYEMDQILEGALTCTTKYEVYVRPASGSWKKVDTFTMLGDEAIVDVSWNEKIDVDEIVVLCQHNKKFSFLSNAAFSDAIYEPLDSIPSYTNNNGSYLSGHWSDTQKRVSTCYAYPFILDAPLKKCRGFTVDFEVEVVSGKMKSNSGFAVYIYDGSNWEKAGSFTLDDFEATARIKLNKAKTIYQIVAVCMNSGTFTYNNYMGIRDPIF